MEFKKIESASIEEVGHDPLKLELHVKFKNGKTGVYHSVDTEKFEAFIKSDSKGKHLNSVFKAKDKDGNLNHKYTDISKPVIKKVQWNEEK